MTHIFTISETFYDILFDKGGPVSACPGGSMLNSSISLGRADVPVSFISEFALDNVGTIIHNFLNDNNVSTRHLCLYEGKSPLALAFLNENNDATYEFYEDSPRNVLMLKFQTLSVMILSCSDRSSRSQRKLEKDSRI